MLKFQDDCLCNLFFDNTCLYAYKEKESRFFEKQMALMEPHCVIQEFSGRPRIHQSRWFHPAKLCCCLKCKAWYFITFEESDVADYIIRLQENEASLILTFPNWPNNNWPNRLKDWYAFEKINFNNWENFYNINYDDQIEKFSVSLQEDNYKSIKYYRQTASS